MIVYIIVLDSGWCQDIKGVYIDGQKAITERHSLQKQYENDDVGVYIKEREVIE
jgi:hypothetical protein